MSDEFKLPGSSYQEVSRIIQGYASLGKASSLSDVSKTVGGMDPTSISRNTGFLVSLGILEPGKNKAPTSLGVQLGNALMHGLEEEVQRLFSKAVIENEFLKGVLSAIRIRKGMDDNALRSHIAYSAGAKKSTTTTTGAGTVIDILQVARLITTEDGKFVVASPMSGSIVSEPSSKESDAKSKHQPEEGLQSQTSVGSPKANVVIPSGSSGLAISINIEVSCDASDLDTLGQKLRRVIDELEGSRDQSDKEPHVVDTDTAE